MGEYDAFGREAGEDTLAESGWRSESASPPASMETAAHVGTDAPVPESPDDPGLEVSTVTRHAARGFVRLLRVGIFIVTLGVIGSGLVTFGGIVDDPADIDLPAITIPPLSPGTPGTPSAEATPPAGLQPRSLIRRAEFSRAMRLLRVSNIGRITNLRVAADRIDVQVLTAGGYLRNVQIQPGAELREVSRSGPGFGHLDTIAYGDVDPAAPQRLTREAARRRGASPTRVDYLVALRIGDEVLWSLFFKNGVQFQADAAGRATRRVPG